MNPHFGPAPQVPQPTTDGLARAFRAADRRRLRTVAFATVAPVLVAFLMTAPFGQDGERGLQPVAPPSVTATPATRPMTSPSEMPAVEPAKRVGGPGGTAHPAEAAPAASVPPPSALPQPGAPPRPDDSRALVLTGDGTSHAELRTTRAYRLNLAELTHGGDETGPYGFYVESADQSTTRLGKVHLPGRSPDTSWVWFAPQPGSPVDLIDLPAGSYTFWLVGTGPTWLSLPFGDEAVRGFTVRTRHPAETRYLTRGWSGSGAAVREARLQIPVAPTRVAGFVLADASEGLPGARLTACDATPGADCAPGSPYFVIQEPYFAYQPLWLVDEVERDAVALWQGGDVTSTVRLTVGYFLIYL